MDEAGHSSRTDILDLMDGFIEKMLNIRKILLGVSVSGIILAPFAIGLSIFLITHPKFFQILQSEYEFGSILGVLLGVIISFSVVWFVLGIRQHIEIKSWNKKYADFLKEKDELNKKIASQYGLDED